MAFPTEVEHLSVEEVSAYLDGALLDADRERIQAHLADCPECREEVVELSRLIRTSRTRPMLRWMATVGVAASLALIVSRVSFLGPNTATPNPSHSIERGPSAAETGKLSILQ